jgi:hypothetical protein
LKQERKQEKSLYDNSRVEAINLLRKAYFRKVSI